MAEWLSACIKKQPKVGDALRDLTKKIHAYEDAAKPSSCRKERGEFLCAELELFRPGWKHFTIIIVMSGITGVVFSLVKTNYYEVGVWGDLALTVTVPVFVLGVSIVMLARSMSESGRFAVEYLNKSCRMAWFCCLTLMAVLAAFIGRFLSMVGWFPTIAKVGLCAASLGAV